MSGSAIICRMANLRVILVVSVPAENQIMTEFEMHKTKIYNIYYSYMYKKKQSKELRESQCDRHIDERTDNRLSHNILAMILSWSFVLSLIMIWHQYEFNLLDQQIESEQSDHTDILIILCVKYQK